MRWLRWWHPIVLMALAGGALAFWFVYEPQDRRELTWTLEVRGPSSPETVDRAEHLLAGRFAGSARVRVVDGRIVVTMPGNRDPARDLGDFEYVEAELKAPPPRIELVFFDDGSQFMQDLFEIVRRDKAAADLGIQAVSDHHQVGSTDQADYYLIAADKGRYVNTAWATSHGCETADDAERKRIEGLGVYCIVRGSDLIRAYLVGDADLGVSPHDTSARPVMPADRAIAFEPAGDKAWRTRFRDAESVVLDPTTVVGTREFGRELQVDLNAATGETLVARAKLRRVVAIDGDRYAPVAIKQDGLNVEVTVTPYGGSARDLAYAFDLAALGVRLVLQDPRKSR